MVLWGVEPGLLIYRFSHSMYYAKAQQLSEEVLELAESAQPSLDWLCIDIAAVDDVDYTGAATLRALHASLRERGTRLMFAAISDDVRAELQRSGLVECVGEDAFYPTVGEALDAYPQRAGLHPAAGQLE